MSSKGVPQEVRVASAGGDASVPLAKTAGHPDRLMHGRHDFADADRVRIAPKHVSPARTSDRADEALAPQLHEELLKIRQGQLQAA